MLNIKNIINQSFKLFPNDIYIGRKYEKYNSKFDQYILSKPTWFTDEDYHSWLTDIVNGKGSKEQNEEMINLAKKYKDNNDYYLVCWCFPRKCEADIIIQVIQENIDKLLVKIENDNKESEAINNKQWKLSEMKQYLEFETLWNKILSSNINILEIKKHFIVNCCLDVNLTECQQKALDVYVDFLHSDEKCLLLTGGGGVGKSFLMELMAIIVDKENSIVLSPKHKIKKLHENKGYLYNNTFHSFLTISENRNKINQKTGKQHFECTNRSKAIDKIYSVIGDEDRIVIFFDECSMIGEDVYHLIMDLLSDKIIKIVFVGDNAQIKPIGEDISLTITQTKTVINLNTVVRYSGELLEYCTKLRQEILSDVKYFSFHKKSDDNQMIKTIINEFEAILMFANKYRNGTNIKILTFKNSSMERYNKILNSILFKEEIDEGFEFFVGQKIIYNNQSAYYQDHENLELIKTKNSTFFVNSSSIKKFDEFKITDVEYGTQKLNGKLFNDKNEPFLPMLNYYYLSNLQIEQREQLIEVCNTIFNWCFITALDEIGKEVYLRVLSQDSEDKYFEVLNKFKKQKQWNIYYFILRQNNWVQPSLALTIDQSQGSTYDEIVLDCNGIENKFNINRYYVGISRAKNNLYLLK